VVLGGVTVGAWAVVAAGAVVARDVAPHSLVIGVPAAHAAWVGRSGHRLDAASNDVLVDPATGSEYRERDGVLEEIT
jgi:serine acetyltransferase